MAGRSRSSCKGRPLGHPSHPLFVHFPVAYYIAALGLDVLSRLGRFPWAPVAATTLILGAFVASVFAAGTGLLDWWGMRPGSRTRRVANRHLLLQATTASFYVADFAIRWPDRHQPRADPVWILLEALGVVALLFGQYLGGVLVYRIGFRVGSSSTTEKA